MLHAWCFCILCYYVCHRWCFIDLKAGNKIQIIIFLTDLVYIVKSDPRIISDTTIIFCFIFMSVIIVCAHKITFGFIESDVQCLFPVFYFINFDSCWSIGHIMVDKQVLQVFNQWTNKSILALQYHCTVCVNFTPRKTRDQ